MTAGFVYVLSHPAWRGIGGPGGPGVVKIGSTSRNPARRLAEITGSSGLIQPGRVEFCLWVADRQQVENRIKQDVLRHQRLRKKRELYRVTPEEARAAIERAAADVASKPWVVDRPRPASRPGRRSWSRWRLRRRTWRVIGASALALASLWSLGLLPL